LREKTGTEARRKAAQGRARGGAARNDCECQVRACPTVDIAPIPVCAHMLTKCLHCPTALLLSISLHRGPVPTSLSREASGLDTCSVAHGRVRILLRCDCLRQSAVYDDSAPGLQGRRRYTSIQRAEWGTTPHAGSGGVETPTSKVRGPARTPRPLFRFSPLLCTSCVPPS